MIRLIPGEKLEVDAGSNTDLRVRCEYTSKRQPKRYGAKLNAVRRAVAEGPAVINYLSVFNNDASSQTTSIIVVTDGTDCYLYNDTLTSKKGVVLWGDGYTEL